MTVPSTTPTSSTELELVDQDILDAMQKLPGYVDISTDDFRTLYHLAYHHAAERLAGEHAGAATTLKALEPPRVSNVEILWSWGGAFVAIALLMACDGLLFDGRDLALMNGSFGASSALLFGAARSPFSQPRNLLGGYLLSALVGVTCYALLGAWPSVAAALAVATAIGLMHLTRTLHPPAAGIALSAVIGSTAVHDAGYLFVLVPATVGPVLLLAVALAYNNLSRTRRYPEVWF